MLLPSLANAEWLEADGLGGFAMGTLGGVRTRRYHSLLTTAVTPPTGRVVLVSGFDAWLETSSGRVALTSQAYCGGVIHPDGRARLESFDSSLFPTWRWRIDKETVLEHELFVTTGRSRTCVRWRIVSNNRVDQSLRLLVRPFLAARDYHSLQHENDVFDFKPRCTKSRDSDGANTRVQWQPFPALPAIISESNGDYHHEPDWYRQFLYADEADRGLDCLEDLAAPGWLIWDLSHGSAVWIVTAQSQTEREAKPSDVSPIREYESCRTQETARRRAFKSSLHRATDAYIVRRGDGHSIIAGYPWFTDWGRDTFIALRGLCLATGRLDIAKSILLSWAETVSDGMLPNRFCDGTETAEFNSVDASLWFAIVVQEFLEAAARTGWPMSSDDEWTLRLAMQEILEGYARGTRFGIRLDYDGLIAAGQPGVQLTWMDAKVGDWVVTPRSGKPVEVQALWLNALWGELQHAQATNDAATLTRWRDHFNRGCQSFAVRFWNDAERCLFDVVDAGHEAGATDASIRPNQIFAAGGLPLTLLPRERAKSVVQVVESRLWTPLGLRTLAPGSTSYCGRYGGSPRQRDAAYHQGTAWAWLLGPFVEAWLKSQADLDEAKALAQRKFIEPLLAHRFQAGWDHVSEIADGDWPHTPRGCPFQAWSLGELLRLQTLLTSANGLRNDHVSTITA